MANDEFLEPPESIADEVRDAAPAQAAEQAQTEFRGIGKAGWTEQPIACMVEVVKRIEDEVHGKWKLNPGIGAKGTWAFAIMGAKPSTTAKRGRFEGPAREAHPAFEAFNTCSPERAQKLPAILISPRVEDCWTASLGMYMTPQGQKPPTGWFCKGDGINARRWNGANSVDISCPDTMCEYRLTTPAKCKPHTGLFAQLNWSPESPMPRWAFKWQSQSLHAYANMQGLFNQVKQTAFGILHPDKVNTIIDPDQMPPFPLTGLPIILSVSETVGSKKRFPEVHVSSAVNLGEWIMAMIGAMKSSRDALPGGGCPMPILPSARVVPALPCGVSQDEMDAAADAHLNPSNYKPANER
jgi:hypothetical protein